MQIVARTSPLLAYLVLPFRLISHQTPVPPGPELAGGTAAQQYTRSQCKWGLPVLQPANRSGDGWGLGWDKLFEVEVIDRETADSMEVCCITDTSA